MKQTMLTLFVPLLAALCWNTSCGSDDSSDTSGPTPVPPTPQPSSYDIYTAGYKTVESKAVATVWKNGTELYALSDGTSNAWAYGLCIDNGTLYIAGYEEQTDGHIVAVLWENDALKYTLGTTGSNSYAYSVAVSGSDIYAAGSATVNGALTATLWQNGNVLYNYSVSPANSQARTLLLSGTDLYVAGDLQTGSTQQVAQIWKNADAYQTLTDGTTPGDIRELFLADDTLYAAGSSGETATVWSNDKLLYSLTDGSSSAEAMSLWMTDGTLYTAGYYTATNSEEQGVVWQNGTQLYTLSNGTAAGSIPYAIAAWGEDVFTAGTRFGSGRHATVWKGSEILYELGRGEAYAMYVVPSYDDSTGE